MEKRLFTSESVTEGHPDKMCDAISDAILDALMEQDPMSRVACETATTTGIVMVMGEITTMAIKKSAAIADLKIADLQILLLLDQAVFRNFRTRLLLAQAGTFRPFRMCILLSHTQPGLP